MFDWKIPSLSDLSEIKNAAEINNQFGNEMSAANLFLYRNKYNTIQIAIIIFINSIPQFLKKD